MSTTRRRFLKTGVALPAVLAGVPALERARERAETDRDAPQPAAPPAGFSRGVGIYPGDPAEYFGPMLAPDTSGAYRNLALLRPAYASSSYDYNLTAQLVTDGIRESRLPRWLEVEVPMRGALPREEREFAFDHAPTSVTELGGPEAWLQIKLAGAAPPAIDRFQILFTNESFGPVEGLNCQVLASNHGRAWRMLAETTDPRPISPAAFPAGFARPGHIFAPSLRLAAESRARYYRFRFSSAAGGDFSRYRVAEIRAFRRRQRVEIGGPYDFTSAWKPAGLGEEWVYVDLGAGCVFDKITLHWIRPAAAGEVQVSDDAESWRTLAPLEGTRERVQTVSLPRAARGRYVRLLLTRPASPQGYILSELEVYGRGGMLAQPAPPPAAADGRRQLAGGGWRLQRDSRLQAGPRARTPAALGRAVSQPGYDASAWPIATVPGTALASYLNLGALPDPNYGQNQLAISDSFFYADFWYRTEFDAPGLSAGQRAWLQLDGVNWKAEVFCNGARLGRIEGAFLRGRFDLTPHLRPGGNNALAVRVLKNRTPGSCKQKTFATNGKNGGGLGLDNPTFHASIGWDWIPTIRGRNTGLWNQVALAVTGPVTIEDPFIETRLPQADHSVAEVSIEAALANHGASAVSGALEGQLGAVRFSQPVTLAAGERRQVRFTPGTHPALRIAQPKLWWPAGYGEPHLYDLELAFTPAGGASSDRRRLKAGLRQVTYNQDQGALRLWINGRRFIPRGGNWGFSESLLRYRAREYDIALRYHREMHFTMVRNWVGQIGEDAFYEACDRHGIMVWQDFWLANPWDGPEPADGAMFLQNARDTILRIRHHASMGLYCGRNEGFPPPRLEAGIQKLLAELHPDLPYIPSSADGPVSGHGPYQAMPLEFYFTRGASPTLHSEMGMPNIPEFESVRAMMPAAARWPQGLEWGLHDFTLQGAENGRSYRRLLEAGYGGAGDAAAWTALAQWLNYAGYRAMFEGQGKYRMGLLIWMSHCAWPSFVWQTYDYYFDCSAAYYGCRKGCEPLHIQWNAAEDTVEVVNNSGGNRAGLTARAEIFNLDGRPAWSASAPLSSPEDSCQTVLRLPGGAAAETAARPAGSAAAAAGGARLSALHFLRLRLEANGGAGPVSENFYWRPLEPGHYHALRLPPPARVSAQTESARAGDTWHLSTRLRNLSRTPALLVRLSAAGERDGARILPAFFEDNYVSLMPGETRHIACELRHADTRGQRPAIRVEGFNLKSR